MVFYKAKSILQDEDFKEILSKGFSFLLVRFGGLIIGFIFTYLIATKYGASVNGLVALSFSLLLCISILGRIGIEVNLIRYYSLSENNNDKGLFYRVFLLALFLSSIFALFLYIFQDFFCYYLFDKPQLFFGLLLLYLYGQLY